MGIIYKFCEPGPRRRYVRLSADKTHYEFCEQSTERLGVDLAQGIATRHVLPREVIARCRAHFDANGYSPLIYACEWPL